MFRMIFEMIGFALKFIIALFLIITVGGQLFSTFEEDGAILWPMIGIVAVTCIISMAATLIIHNRKYRDNPDDPNRIYIDGKEYVTEEEEKRRKRECDMRLVKIWWWTCFPLLIAFGIYAIIAGI